MYLSNALVINITEAQPENVAEITYIKHIVDCKATDQVLHEQYLYYQRNQSQDQEQKYHHQKVVHLW